MRSAIGSHARISNRLLLCLCLLFFVAVCVMSYFIKDDETVIFFPTYGSENADGTSWDIPVHAWIFEMEEDSLFRRGTIKLFAKAIGLESSDEKNAFFKERARYFLVDNERGKKPSVELLEVAYRLRKSSPNGHSKNHLRVPASAIEGYLKKPQGAIPTLDFKLLHDSKSRGLVRGRVFLLPQAGVSVVSDIDDTIKISEVGDKRALLRNTFLREFEAVPGMAKRYTQWADTGASFHYISASPWQLYPALSEFLDNSSFPQGTFHLKSFRWKDTSFFNLLKSSAKIKTKAIEELITKYPKRRFIFVGDSGEKDPELYAALALKYPSQVIHVFIRNTAGENSNPERFETAFQALPKNFWTVFSSAEELPSDLDF